MEQAYFVTGTDTNIGKTWSTVALMRYFRGQGKTVAGMKPVASGCRCVDGKLVNDDALLLMANATVAVDYDMANPYAYELPVSPHIAGKDSPAELGRIIEAYGNLCQQAQVVLVEGAGGWCSPITSDFDNGDLAKALTLPVILVVGIRLGCINHARLTYDAILAKGLICAGWVANLIDPDSKFQDEVLAALIKSLHAPLLGKLPFLPEGDFELLAQHIKCGPSCN